MSVCFAASVSSPVPRCPSTLRPARLISLNKSSSTITRYHTPRATDNLKLISSSLNAASGRPCLSFRLENRARNENLGSGLMLRLAVVRSDHENPSCPRTRRAPSESQLCPLCVVKHSNTKQSALFLPGCRCCSLGLCRLCSVGGGPHCRSSWLQDTNQ